MKPLNNLINKLQDYKSIAIFGYGVEGQSFYRFAQKYLQDTNIIIVDKNVSQNGIDAKTYSGDDYLDALKLADIIIKSPGISLNSLGIDYKSYNFTSLSELFLEFYGSQVIGISGTKGKSTLATLTHDMFKNAGLKSILGGNIGIPVFDVLEGICDQSIIVMELSSHQLLHIKQSPHISIITNLFPEHLDYYKDLDEYYNAKFNLFRHQKSDDIFLYDDANSKNYKTVKSRCQNLHHSELKYSVEFSMKRGFIHKNTLMFLERLKEMFSVSDKVYLQTLESFKTLEHRLEYVSEVDDVYFINDSISTIPQACIEAIKLLKDVDSVILGGNDRGVSYDELVDFLTISSLSNVICFSDTGKKIFDLLNKKESNLKVILAKDLEESVKLAYSLTKKSKIVLFSPAASSFNEYKNFAFRGRAFKEFVLAL